MKKKNFRILSVFLILAIAFSMTALAASSSKTKNGIKLSLTANRTSGESVVSCSSATATGAYLSLYDSSGSRVKYVAKTGVTYAYAYADGVANRKAVGSSSAKISGSYVTGPSITLTY